jgi:S-adenosyl methyltransferase
LQRAVRFLAADPIVHVHANALLTGSGALLLVAIMHFITDAEDPARILAVFRDALPAGSYLALSHATADFRPAAGRRNWCEPGSTAASPARAHDRGRSPPPAHSIHQAERGAVPALGSSFTSRSKQ